MAQVVPSRILNVGELEHGVRNVLGCPSPAHLRWAGVGGRSPRVRTFRVAPSKGRKAAAFSGTDDGLPFIMRGMGTARLAKPISSPMPTERRSHAADRCRRQHNFLTKYEDARILLAMMRITHWL